MWSCKVGQIALALAAGSAGVMIYVAVFPNVVQALWHAITGAREDASILARIADYAEVSQTFRAHPVFGLGLGGAPPDVYGLLDNEWLRAIVQGGIVGVTAMIVVWVEASSASPPRCGPLKTDPNESRLMCSARCSSLLWRLQLHFRSFLLSAVNSDFFHLVRLAVVQFHRPLD